MLNRVKKNLITAILAGTMCLALPCFSMDSTISYVNINDLAYQDIEIVITDKNEILVPFKQLADIFEIKYDANRVEKRIGFTTIDGKEGFVTQQGVFINDSPITNMNPVFMTQGIIDGVFNEAYIPASAAEEIMGIKLEPDFETLSLNAQVTRDIPLLHNANPVAYDDKSPRAYQDVVAPKKQGRITLNTIGLRSNLLNDNLSVEHRDGHKSDSTTFAGSTQASLNGRFLDGKYRIEASEYHYRNDAFIFGGITGTYRNSIRDVDTGKEKAFFELGRVRGIIDNDILLGTNIFGAQIWNYDNEKPNPRRVCGYVKPTSLVRLTVNDLEPVTLSTYSGYYTLKDVQLPNPVKKIKLEEINEDGTVELISEEKYSIYDKDTPFEKEHRKTAYAGVWGYQNRLFRDGGNIYRGNNKKMTAGGEYRYGIKDNITFKSKLSADKIYEKSESKVVHRVPTNDTLLVSGTQKSVNYLEGATSMSSVEWRSPNNKYIRAEATAGASVAHDTRMQNTHAGYIGKLTGEYENQDLIKYQKGIFKPRRVRGKLEVYQTSPDFYIASTDSTSKNDRTGGRVTGGLGFNATNIGGSYGRFWSNRNHRYRGGTITFDEATINASTKIPKVAELRFSTFFRRGENDLGRNKNYNYDANISREFDHGIKVQAGKRLSYYDTRYNNPNEQDRNYHSKFDDIYMQADTPIPRNLGRFTFGHNFIRYTSGNYKDGYNIFRFGYTFPTWRRITFGVNWGIRYHGQGGHDLGANVHYRAKSGQTMTVGYQYSQNGGYFIDNMFMPTTNRHSINFTFNDAFQVFNNGFKSVGSEDLQKGLFEAIAFVDVDGDGKYTKKVDVPIQDVPLITSWTGETNITNKKGRVCSSTLEEGIYTVSIDMDTLPINVAPTTNEKIINRVKIDGGQTTRLEIPLVSTVGSVSGVLKISDDFDRKLKITDFVVVLLDESGNEVNYSTVDSTGEFYISGLAPGKYILQLDERFISAYGLEEGAASKIQIIIPEDYYNPTDIIDQTLEYKALAL